MVPSQALPPTASPLVRLLVCGAREHQRALLIVCGAQEHQHVLLIVCGARKHQHALLCLCSCLCVAPKSINMHYWQRRQALHRSPTTILGLDKLEYPPETDGSCLGLLQIAVLSCTDLKESDNQTKPSGRVAAQFYLLEAVCGHGLPHSFVR